MYVEITRNHSNQQPVKRISRMKPHLVLNMFHLPKQRQQKLKFFSKFLQNMPGERHIIHVIMFMYDYLFKYFVRKHRKPQVTKTNWQIAYLMDFKLKNVLQYRSCSSIILICNVNCIDNTTLLLIRRKQKQGTDRIFVSFVRKLENYNKKSLKEL